MHKLATIADRQCQVTSMDDINVAVKIGSDIERVLLYKVVTSSISSTGAPFFVNAAT